MGKGKRRNILIFSGELRKLSDHIYQLLTNKIQCIAHNDDVGVIADIAARCAEVNDSGGLRALQPVCVNMAHDVMSYQLLALLCNSVIDVVDMHLHLIDHLLRDDRLSVLRQTELHLGLGKGNPKLSPGRKLLVLAENVLHLRRSVTLGEGACVSAGIAHDISPEKCYVNPHKAPHDQIISRMPCRKMKP